MHAGETMRCKPCCTMILRTTLQWKQQNTNQTLNSQKTSHSSPSRPSYGVFAMRIWKKMTVLQWQRIVLSLLLSLVAPNLVCIGFIWWDNILFPKAKFQRIWNISVIVVMGKSNVRCSLRRYDQAPFALIHITYSKTSTVPILNRLACQFYLASRAFLLVLCRSPPVRDNRSIFSGTPRTI